MSEDAEIESAQVVLRPAWLVLAAMLLLLLSYVVVCHVLVANNAVQYQLPAEHRVLLRTVLYAVAIVSFPLTNLLRHVQLRLNQTMPGNKPAKQRYFLTVLVSMLSMEVIGVFGLLMFLLGDNFNTLYIFTGMAMLGLYLYRPKLAEYEEIVMQLAMRRQGH